MDERVVNIQLGGGGGCVGSSLLHTGFLQSCGLPSSGRTWASHCGSFFCYRAQALGHVGFTICAAWI